MTRRYAKKLPTIWLMTDERIGEVALLAGAARLPKGQAGIVVRHYHTAEGLRRALFARLAVIARRRRLALMLAGTAREAAAWKADGWHGRDTRRVARPLLHSAPVHDARDMQAARRRRVDVVLLSPLYPTRSHPGGRSLGRVRFAALAQSAGMPVMAMGGVRKAQRHILASIGASGWAAIDGLVG